MEWILVGIVFTVVVVVLANRQAKKNRIAFLMSKYGDANIVRMIMEKKVWVSQTEEQLRESLGPPVDIDEKVMKTKVKRVYKYSHQGGNRYGFRVTVDNGVVSGWDEKQ